MRERRATPSKRAAPAAAKQAGRANAAAGGALAAVLCVCAFAMLVRAEVAVHPYSGAGKPPMYGDYEAQRHWMEITVNLPVREWYFNTSANDLLYWGLDYPPLTAYFSWAFGKLAQVVHPPLVELGTSRGLETPPSKLFMRASALVSDLTCFFPAAMAFCALHYTGGTSDRTVALLLVLLQPAPILVDHGHFQYNAVCLGLAMLAALCAMRGRHLACAMLFCAALNYKQMSLYYAPAFFFWLLGSSWKQSTTFLEFVLRVVKLGIAVGATFALCWAPFLTSTEQLFQVVHRIFPLDRGLYEDKVANVWCALSPLLKLKLWLAQSHLALLSLTVTLAALIPIAIVLLRRPTTRNLLLGMTASALAFFLFSYQVHEKTILFPLIPLSFLVLEMPLASCWLGVMSTFSMFPLLQRDGLSLAYTALLPLFTSLSLMLTSAWHGASPATRAALVTPSPAQYSHEPLRC
eukprot:TRINITY_DN3310_c0_g1_i1.p1 TRINITY_DN3310_c0_g1~~TRINITY_DN3310_c0_g1_i1.p1  ORF type:complete len:486 (-),score=119.07 TRINITY_DN3310_c0_g1_i1:461-1849(-)